MSLNTLLESANQYKSLQSDAMRLAKKWQRTGLLEGLGNDISTNNMAMILENQAQQLVNESSQTSGGVRGGGHFESGVGEQWAGVALPLVRKVFGQIAAKEFVSVQPMNLPSGLVFFLDFQYGSDLQNRFTKGNSLYGDMSADGREQPFGNTNKGGLYGAGRFAYSINNKQVTYEVPLGTTWDVATAADMNYDTAFTYADYSVVTIPADELVMADFTGVRGFQLSDDTGAEIETIAEFTKLVGPVGSKEVVFIVKTTDAPAAEAEVTVTYQVQPEDNLRGDFEDENESIGEEIGNGTVDPYNTHTPIEIPEINVGMKSSPITAKTRKLKAVWTPEFAQDLNAYHAIDAEAELTGMMSEYISLEIDLEILDMLSVGAAGGDEVWSAKNNTSMAADGTTTQLGYYNSQHQWFQTLGTKVQKLSNKIHQKTLRGGINFLVVSPQVSTVFESIAGFAASTDGDVTKSSYAFGAQKVGTLNGKYKIYKNPYMQENMILAGYKGNQFLETGAVFAPYIPLIMTPLLYDPETFTPRKGLLTRYAKKMLRPEYYGRIFISDLETI